MLSSMIRSRSRTMMRRVTAVASHRRTAFSSPCRAPGLLDHFNGRALPEVRLAGTRIDASRGVEIDIGIGDGNLDQIVM